MFKRFVRIFSVLFLTTSSWAAHYELNLFLWNDYIDPKVIKEFSDKFNCRITLTAYEDADTMLRAIQAGGVSHYDIVLPPDHMVPMMVKSNLLAPLRHENIPHLSNLDEKFMNPPFDPGNKFTAAYLWGTVGIYIRKGAAKHLEESWSLIFDAKKRPGPFVLIDSPRDMISAALRYGGHSSNSGDDKDLKHATEILLDAKKRSLGFAGGLEGRNKVLDRSATTSVVYSADGLLGMKEDPQTYYFVPREGGRIWLDNIAVPAQAPNRDMAEKFINYVLEPKVAARLSTFLHYATPNKAAKQFLEANDLEHRALYPPPERMAKLELWEDQPDRLSLHDEIWKKVKAK